MPRNVDAFLAQPRQAMDAVDHFVPAIVEKSAEHTIAIDYLRPATTPRIQQHELSTAMADIDKFIDALISVRKLLQARVDGHACPPLPPWLLKLLAVETSTQQGDR